MFVKVYEGTRATKSGHLFDVEITKVADSVHENYEAVIYDGACDADAYDETHYDVFTSFDAAMRYVDSIESRD